MLRLHLCRVLEGSNHVFQHNAKCQVLRFQTFADPVTHRTNQLYDLGCERQCHLESEMPKAMQASKLSRLGILLTVSPKPCPKIIKVPKGGGKASSMHGKRSSLLKWLKKTVSKEVSDPRSAGYHKPGTLENLDFHG